MRNCYTQDLYKETSVMVCAGQLRQPPWVCADLAQHPLSVFSIVEALNEGAENLTPIAPQHFAGFIGGGVQQRCILRRCKRAQHVTH